MNTTMMDAIADLLGEMKAELRSEIEAKSLPDALYRSVALRRLKDEKQTLTAYCNEFLHKAAKIEGEAPRSFLKSVKA